MAELPLELPDGVPLAGFAQRLSKNQGTRDPVSVRALALFEPGCSVVLVSAEILLVPASLTRVVRERLTDLNLDVLVLGATHTHSGPGGYWKHLLAEYATMGQYQPQVFEALANRIVEVVRRAVSTRVPVELSTARAELPALARNRNGGAVDGHLLLVRLTGYRGPLAQVVVFPAHPTLLGMENRRISGDWPGALMRGQPVTTLFFQGAAGDQSVQMPPDVASTPSAYAGLLSAELAKLRLSAADPAPPLAAAVASTLLPAPDPGASPGLLRRLSANLTFGFFPERSSVTALRLGPVMILAVPAEPVAEVGRLWRAAVGDGAEVVSLAGDYLAYVDTSERVSRREGEAVRTLFGPELERRLGQAVVTAATAADGRGGTAP